MVPALGFRRARSACLVGVPIAVLGAACSGPADPIAGLEAPNLLLIVVDCLRSDHVSINGYRRPTTPSLDAIAAQGVSFTQAISQSTWTRPTMPTLLTGLYPSEHGILGFEKGDDGEVLTSVLDQSVETLAERLETLGYRNAVFAEQAQLDPSLGLDQGFHVYCSHLGGAKQINDTFLDWLSDESPDRFFAMLHYFDLHWPYCPPPTALRQFRPAPDSFNPCRGANRLLAEIRSKGRVLTDDELTSLIAFYDAEVLAVDRRLGLLAEELTKRGIWDETLVIVTADHGEEFFEHGGAGHSNWPWDELIRVPLVVKPPQSWPGRRGVLRDDLVESRAVVATLEHAAGLDLPSRATSLVPALTGRRFSAAEFVVTETNFCITIRTPEWKLMTDRDGGSPRLYDLANDPRETRDVARDHRREVARLKSYLNRWREGLLVAESTREAIEDETVRSLKAIGYLE